MEAIEAIMTRRCVRKFSGKQIPDAVLEKIIKAGTYAPSALALQPWGFIVIQDQAFLTRVSDYCKPIIVKLLGDAHDEMSDAFRTLLELSLIHISEPTRQAEISYAVFCLKKKKNNKNQKKKKKK